MTWADRLAEWTERKLSILKHPTGWMRKFCLLLIPFVKCWFIHLQPSLQHGLRKMGILRIPFFFAEVGHSFYLFTRVLKLLYLFLSTLPQLHNDISFRGHLSSLGILLQRPVLGSFIYIYTALHVVLLLYGNGNASAQCFVFNLVNGSIIQLFDLHIYNHTIVQFI